MVIIIVIIIIFQRSSMLLLLHTRRWWWWWWWGNSPSDKRISCESWWLRQLWWSSWYDDFDWYVDFDEFTDYDEFVNSDEYLDYDVIFQLQLKKSRIQCNICSVRQRRRVRKNRIMHITPSGHPDHYSHAIWRHRHHHHHRQRHPHHHLYCNCHCHRHRQCHRHHHRQHHRHHHHHRHQHCHFHCNWLFMTQEWRPEGRLQWIQEITAKILGSPQLVLGQALIMFFFQAHLGSTDLQAPCWSPISISLSAIIFGSCLCSTMHDAEYQPKAHKNKFYASHRDKPTSEL